MRVGFSDGLCCRSHTDAQPLHGEALVANEVVVLSVVFHGSPGPVEDIVVFVRYQGLDAAATIVVAALRRAVLPGGPFPQTADLRDGPGKVGNVFLHVRQLVRDAPQFLPKKKLLAIGKINVKAAQIVIVRVGREFEKLRNAPVQLDSLLKRRL